MLLTIAWIPSNQLLLLPRHLLRSVRVIPTRHGFQEPKLRLLVLILLIRDQKLHGLVGCIKSELPLAAPLRQYYSSLDLYLALVSIGCK